jgi:exodeoxyribonuclease VII small subunit
MAGGRKTGKDREPAFEEALRRLETIVERLESGDLALEESLRLFEEGVVLTRLCAGRLDEAQRRIEALTKTEDGLRLLPFEAGGRGPADDTGADR